MKPYVMTILIGSSLLTIGWLSALGQEDGREQAERERQNARQAQREAEERERQALEIERDERAAQEAARRKEQSLHRELELKEIRAKLQDLHVMREELGEDHPQVQAVLRQIRVLEEEHRELAGDEHGHHPAHQGEREQLQRKIEHLHGAAGHLDEAGVPEMARELREQANHLERELHKHHPEHAEPQELLRELQNQMRDMQREIQNLQEEVTNLKRQLREREN